MHDNTTARGRILRGVGGLYSILLDGAEGSIVSCRARGLFRHLDITPLPGDRVELALTERADTTEDNGDGGEMMIAEIIDRRSALIRPPLANLDYLFITMASAKPTPIPETIDKLTAIAEHNGIEPVIVIGKSELDPAEAERLAAVYRSAGYAVFSLSCRTGEGIAPLRAYIAEHLPGKVAAFAGASGVGKSTLMTELFPTLQLETGGLSRKIERGRHTTRQVDLYPLDVGGDKPAFLADTPGFSMLDFARFDFFSLDDLPHAMREFAPHLGKCRYTDCTHLCEEGCAIVEAVAAGEIAPSRHASYCAMYAVLKEKKAWK
ncbi:MAG: ribosome small subunit-dependent GTPase A [Clostridia bacterium]|nr:ribosome small subunit-dependent GTPase A [Clostridia bacterium]